MKTNLVGIEKLSALAGELLGSGLPVDVVETGELAFPRTDKNMINSLLEAFGDADLVVPFGKLSDGSHLVALEIDQSLGGEETFKQLWANCPIAPTTVIQAEDDLMYLLMKCSGSPRTNRVKLGDGLTLLAKGNYIVVPPREGNRVDGWWKNFPASMDDLATVPAKLAALL